MYWDEKKKGKIWRQLLFNYIRISWWRNKWIDGRSRICIWTAELCLSRTESLRRWNMIKNKPINEMLVMELRAFPRWYIQRLQNSYGLNCWRKTEARGKDVSTFLLQPYHNWFIVYICIKNSYKAELTKFRAIEHMLTRMRACERLQKFCEHEQASTRVIFASNSSKGHIFRAPLNWMGPFDTPNEIQKAGFFFLSWVEFVCFEKRSTLLSNAVPLQNIF